MKFPFSLFLTKIVLCKKLYRSHLGHNGRRQSLENRLVRGRHRRAGQVAAHGVVVHVDGRARVSVGLLQVAISR
jgi:hypothetical protein